jgi:hypothetical protein
MSCFRIEVKYGRLKRSRKQERGDRAESREIDTKLNNTEDKVR